MEKVLSETQGFINPEEWRVRGQLRHDGLVYGPADPLPPLTTKQAAQYEASGMLSRLLPDGQMSPPARQAAAPADAAAYLYGPDAGVLRSILDHRPSKRLIQEILTLAKVNGRSFVLRNALEALLLYAGVKHPHGDSRSAASE